MSRFLLLLVLLTAGLATDVAAQVSSSLQVVVSSPRGETATVDQTQAVVASFSQTMVPLREAPTDLAKGPMVIAPGIEGKYRWMGTKTLVFLPARQLPYATRFSVSIPAGTRSLSGKRLAKEVRWWFETPRPRIVSHLPANGQKFLELDQPVLLLLNQPVDPQKASGWLSIEERGEKTATYPRFLTRHATSDEMKPLRERIRQDTDSLYTVMILPAGRLKQSKAYTVRCKAGLQGLEGPLGMQDDYSFTFSTYNELSFNGVGMPDRFIPSLPLRLVFSNPVSIKEVAARLVFEPPLKRDIAEYGYDYVSEQVSISLPLEAETEYKGLLKAGVKDQYGNTITEDHPFRFRTGSFTPYVRMTTGPGVIEATESHSVPVTFMNVDSVLLQAGKVSPERIVPLMTQLNYSPYMEFGEEGMTGTPGRKSDDVHDFTASRIWKIKGPRNKETIRPVDLDELLGAPAKGVVFLQVDNLRPDPTRRYFKTVLQVTNLGITSKFSPESNLLWVTRLREAAPVADASVEIRDDSNRVVWSGKTDSRGLVETPGWGPLGIAAPNAWSVPRQWIIVRSDGDVAFSCSDWQRGIEPWSFGISTDWNPRFEPVVGALFTDRGLYKAGETVEMKGVFRTNSKGSWKVAAGTRIRITVRDSRNEEILRNEFELSPFGSLALSLPLKPASPLGYYAMQAEAGTTQGDTTAWNSVAWGSFRVEAFRPAEFEVLARTDRPSYIIGDTLLGYLSARYLFGGAVRNQPATWRISSSPSGWSPPGWDGYFFGPLSWLSKYGPRPGYQLLSSAKADLDEEGTLRVRSELKVGEMAGTVSVLFEGDVTSPSRQQISGRTSVIVHGGEYYLGLAPSSTLIEIGSPVKYNLVAVTPEGQIRTEVPVNVKVVQRVWRSVRKAEAGGRYGWISEADDLIVDSLLVRTDDKPVLRSFTPREPGFYYVQAEANDERGNALLTQCYFYVSGSGYVAWERGNDDRIELVADKAEYAPGETARILVKSPYEKAIALVTLEREGIISHFTRVLAGSAPEIDIPIRTLHIPNLFVSVVLLQGRVQKPPSQSGGASLREADVGRPSFKVGYVGIPVTPKQFHLAVRVSADRKEYRPGDSVEVRVEVKDAAGKPVTAEVTLSVADRGVLNLIGYRLPDPFDQFYADRSLAVKTTETRMHLVEQREYGEKGEDTGGGGGIEETMALLDAEGLRKDFRYTAYWNASLPTDAEGHASVKFKLPDNLTTFQVMAVAHTRGSEFGAGDTTLVVNKPLLLQPSYPRFVRVGDSFQGGAVIHNYGASEKSIVLVSKAKGVTSSDRDTTVIRLAAGQALEVRRRYRADRAGKATFIVHAIAGEERDGFQWSIPVQLIQPMESVALYESTADSLAREKILIPSSLHPEVGQIQIQVASTPLSELSAGISYLFTYPYGCLEQKLSALLPVIVAGDLMKAFDLDIFEGKNLRTIALNGLGELSAYQRPGGGFSYWKGDLQESPYLSAYAVYVVAEAKRNGYPVDERMLANGMQYLRRVLAGEISYAPYSDLAWHSTRALILYTFAVMGQPDHGYMEKLYAERRRMPLFAEAYLVRALAVAKGNPSMISTLVSDMENMVKISPTSAHFEERDDRGLAWIFDSNVRTTALVLQVLVETAPDHPLIPRLVRWLLDQRKNGTWRTTQENLYVVNALASYFHRVEQDEAKFRAEVRFAGRTVLDREFLGRTLATEVGRVPLSTLKQGSEQVMVLRKDGPGKMYYGVRMEYAPRGEMKAKEEGLSVVKTIERLEETFAGKDTFAVGNLYRVTISVVSNQARNFVAINDPLPAGFEAVNTSLQTTAANLDRLLQGQDVSRDWPFSPFSHQEAYDDRVLLFADFFPAGVYSYSYLVRATSFGTFVVPGTRAEAMYEPEVFGRTSSSNVVVK